VEYITLYVMTPQDRRLAFKYRSGDKATFARDLQCLRESQIYAAPRISLNDPFEGRFDRSKLDVQFAGLKALFGGVKESVASSLENVSKATESLLGFVDKYGVFSLSYNPLNELIWAHYGGSHQGYCVGYDLETLMAFDPASLHCVEVAYGNSSPSLAVTEFFGEKSPNVVLSKLLGAKSLPWRYEEEVRVLAMPPGLHEHDFRAVREVYFGLRCSDETRLAVMDALAGRGVSYKQVRSPHPSYLLQAQEIPDEYATVSSYRARVAPIMEGAILPDYLKPELKQYAGYLVKAAEIVRREPYCEEIQSVEFSHSKSTPGNPVIFVQYLRGPNKWINHYLTLQQIDEQFSALGLPRNDV